MPDLGICGAEFQRDLFIFEVIALEFVKFARVEMPNIGTRNSFFVYFGVENSKSFVIFDIG